MQPTIRQWSRPLAIAFREHLCLYLYSVNIFIWLADVSYVLLLDYGPEALRLEEETLCYLQRRGGSWLWRLSQVIILHTYLYNYYKRAFWKYKQELTMCKSLLSCRFYISFFPSLQRMVLPVVPRGAEPHVLSVRVCRQKQLLLADQPCICHQPRPPLLLLLHRPLYCNGKFMHTSKQFWEREFLYK